MVRILYFLANRHDPDIDSAGQNAQARIAQHHLRIPAVMRVHIYISAAVQLTACNQRTGIAVHCDDGNVKTKSSDNRQSSRTIFGDDLHCVIRTDADTGGTVVGIADS